MFHRRRSGKININMQVSLIRQGPTYISNKEEALTRFLQLKY